jgi:tetratricopeptide (TPR) repeat protein
MRHAGVFGWAVAVLAAGVFTPQAATGQTFEQRLEGAWSLIQRLRYQEAQAEYDQLVRWNPSSASAYNGRAVAWKRLKNLDRALADFNEAIRLDPTTSGYYGNRSDIWFRKKQYDLAMADANEAIRLDPSHFSGFGKRGYYWREQGDYARALADFNVAVQLGNNVSISYRRRAWLLATCPDERFRDGRRAFADASQAYVLSPIIIQGHADGDGPHGSYSMEALAAAYAECGDFKAAVEWQQKALDKKTYDDEEDYVKAQAALELYKTHKPYRFKPEAVPSAVASTNSASGTIGAASPAAPPAPIEVGSRVVLKGKDTPLKVEDRVVTTGKAPRVFRVDRVNGNWLWVVAGDVKGWVQESDAVPLDRAAKFFADLLKDEPKAGWAYARRGAVWRERHEYENAVADFTEAIRHDPDDAGAYAARAWVWASAPEPKARDGKRAVESATRACELTGWKDPDALGALAAALAETGEFDQAARRQQEALALFPGGDKDHPSERGRLGLYKDKKPYRE